MKARIKTLFDKIFYTPKPLPPGTSQAILELNGVPYRLHLRIESEGQGFLIVNASTILHLNPTATEIAWHLINKTPLDQITNELMHRYQVSSAIAVQDIEEFKIRIESLIGTPDLDPETFLDMERVDRHTSNLSAPLRLDCAVTYQVSEGSSERYAPVGRVKRALDTEEWKSIFSKAWEAGIPQIVFTGGEPTLRPDLVELVQHAENLGQVTGMITDGLRLTDTEYFHSLLKSGVDYLMVVIDPDEEQSWEAIRDTLNEDVFVTVHVTINERNKAHMTKILERIHALGVKSISLSAVSKDLSPELISARQLVAELGIFLVYDLPVPYSAINPIGLEMEAYEASKEGAGHTWLYIEPDGDVLLGQGSSKCVGNFLADPWVAISGNIKLETLN